MVLGVEVARLDDGRRRFPLDRAVDDRGARGQRPDRACRSRRQRDGPQGGDGGQGRRGARRRGHAPRGAPGLSGRADRRRAGAGRSVLRPPEDHDDARVRPDHLRTRSPGVLRGRVRTLRRGAQIRRRQPERRGRGDAQGDRVPVRRAACGGAAGDRGGVRKRSAAREGGLSPRQHQPPLPERRYHRRVDARRDPLLGPDVERSRRTRGTRSS